MKEFLILLVVYFLFFLYSIILYRKSLFVNKKLVYILIPIYLVSIYLYFELINYIHIGLRENNIYLEFGHGSILLVLVLILAYLTAFIFLIIYVLKSRKMNK